MKRLTIAIDCDDVLLPAMDRIIYIYNQRHGTNVQLEDTYRPESDSWQANHVEIVERMNDIQMSDDFMSINPFDEAVESCSRLSQDHKLNLVTARPGKIMSVTLAMLNEHFPGMFSEIEHVGLESTKGDVCRLARADALIDDNYGHLITAYKCGIPHLICFGDYPWQDHSVRENIGATRCLDWASVEQEIIAIASRKF